MASSSAVRATIVVVGLYYCAAAAHMGFKHEGERAFADYTVSNGSVVARRIGWRFQYVNERQHHSRGPKR